VGTTEHTEHTEAGNVGTTEHTEHTEARGNRLRVVFRGGVEGAWYLSNPSKTQGKHAKVRFLSTPLVNPGFPRVFAFRRSSFGFLCLSMHVHACRCCPSRNHRLVRCLGPQKRFSASSVSRQSRARTLVFRYTMIKLKQPITPQSSCSAHECFVLFN